MARTLSYYLDCDKENERNERGEDEIYELKNFITQTELKD